MNLQFETAWRLHTFLSAGRIPYAIIGGIAVQRWGQPRLTRDVDLTVLLPRGSEEATLREIVAAFPARIEDAVSFALEHRVLPVNVPGGSEADISLGLPGYEEHVTLRAAVARGAGAALRRPGSDGPLRARLDPVWPTTLRAPIADSLWRSE